MKDSDHLIESIGETIGYAKEYASQRLELTKLEFAEKASLVSTRLVNAVIFFMLGLCALAMGSVSMGLFLGGLLQSYALGFLVIFGLYLLLIGILYVFRRSLITNPILNYVLSLFRNDNNHEQENQ